MVRFGQQTPHQEDEYIGNNTTLNFRVNDNLKSDFSRLCKLDQLSIATAVKRYMINCVREGRLK